MGRFFFKLVLILGILTFCTTASYAQGIIPACPGEALIVGQTNYCFCASQCCPVGGSFCNIFVPGLPQCMDIGSIHYCNSPQQSFCFIVIPDQSQPCNPAIDIEKSTNGEDADTAPGPTIIEGDPVTWAYTVTNVGDVVLSDVQVVDDQLGQVCTIALLNPGGTFTCAITGTAVAGQYANVGTVTATVGSIVLTDSDPSNYFGQARAKYVFVSSTTHAGNFGGASGADTICQNLATTAGFSGTFKAWVSTATSSPASSFTRSSIPYVLTNGTKIADNWDDLTDGSLDAPINISENGTSVSFYAWTATAPNGTLLPAAWWGQNCDNWTSPSGNGYYGLLSMTDDTWSGRYEYNGAPCEAEAEFHLYCFQQ